MAKYRKRPIEIEAVQWDGDALKRPVPDWVREAMENGFWDRYRVSTIVRYGRDLHIKTLEGTMKAEPGDWVIRGISGEIYPCKPKIFEETYEEVG